ncbi:uncharacterized protein (DUF427 family) [Variovorax sp. 54]|uniref:DUF427 domain-containing protein n=1 Tax=Variovorax sp. 54 TaxID=2035212 RepID=UPI000C195EC5|nr:DUF427 domain-containing protein [Variovorax sp. 54]PIF73774.1 uncharacterized protein (DUF427 family) [Variovorax sp. 54]
MNDKIIKTPSPEHPLSIERSSSRVIVRLAGQVVADSTNTLLLKEARYPGVYYIPLADVNASLLTASDLTTYCPYKGDCSYFNITSGKRVSVNAAWFYSLPYPAVAEIKDHLAFYPDRVDSLEVSPSA